MKASLLLLINCIALAIAPAWAQSRVSGSVVVSHPQPKTGNSGVVVWLTPADGHARAPAPQTVRLTQRNKTFVPHLLVIPVGSVVRFPNSDPFFHNVFSLSDGPRFDLGLYEAGSSRSVQFNHAGISYVFCNIHPQMSAVIIRLATPWYAVTGKDGQFVLTGVPAGRYHLHLWYERATAARLAKSERDITVDHDIRLEPITVQSSQMPTSHKNKYGLDYDMNSGNDHPY